MNETRPVRASFESYTDEKLIERFFRTIEMIETVGASLDNEDGLLPSSVAELLASSELLHRELEEIALLLEQRGIKL